LGNLSGLEEEKMTEPLTFGNDYHIYNRGNNREKIFREARNYRYFLKLYAKHIAPVADTYAYALLRNHFHFAIRTRTAAEQETYRREHPDLSGFQNLTGLDETTGLPTIREPGQAFSNLFNAYTKGINKAYGRTGALFQCPFGRVPVTTDRYFRQLIVYIHQNPQKHGFVEDFRQWPYSFYPMLLSLQKTLLQRDELLTWFRNCNGFVFAHDEVIAQTLIHTLVPDDPD
jgi:hypothetical protein